MSISSYTVRSTKETGNIYLWTDWQLSPRNSPILPIVKYIKYINSEQLSANFLQNILIGTKFENLWKFAEF